jgi:hypothetical protein
MSHTNDSGELYDLLHDPEEQINLWNNENFKDEKIRMLELLNKRMALSADPLPCRKSAW